MSAVTSPLAVWSCLVLLLAVHVATNRAAVRAVSMRTLNRQRASIVLTTLIEDDFVLSPQQAAKQERIFEWGGHLRWKGSHPMATGHIGVELGALLGVAVPTAAGSRAIRRPVVELDQLAQLYSDEDFLLWYDEPSKKVLIALKDKASSTSQLKAWTHALMVARSFSQLQPANSGIAQDEALSTPMLVRLRSTLQALGQVFDSYLARLKQAGWDLDTAALETQSGSRVVFQSRTRES